MKKITIILAFYLTNTLTFGQTIPQVYFDLIKQADSLYKENEFKKSALKYSEAFKTIGGIGYPKDIYKDACSWALANEPDSAFFHLNRVAKSSYTRYRHIKTDPDLNSLHDDNRWEPLLEKIKLNKEKIKANKKLAKAKLNKPLIRLLKDIDKDDQKYRNKIDKTEKKYGLESKQMKDLWKIIDETDSINLIKIKSILDQYGWLGPDVIGYDGNSTIFLVIQHSDTAIRAKYLPIMREAVKNGKAFASDLALLEDRVALSQGKRQIYGSQIARDPETKLYFVLPLEDPDNVDKRRKAVCLDPLADYVIYWQIKWDVEQYKKDLPKLEEKIKKK